MADLKTLFRRMSLGLALPMIAASVAAGGNSVTRCIHVSCTAAAGISEPETLCREFRAALQGAYPDAAFPDGASGAPRMEVTITQATPRGIAATVLWVGADGTGTGGTPLQTAFFDRNSDPELRQRFWDVFLRQNPLPF